MIICKPSFVFGSSQLRIRRLGTRCPATTRTFALGLAAVPRGVVKASGVTLYILDVQVYTHALTSRECGMPRHNATNFCLQMRRDTCSAGCRERGVHVEKRSNESIDRSIAVAHPPARLPPQPPPPVSFGCCCSLPLPRWTKNKTRIIAALESNQVTEKTLALGLSEAVNQHDAEAAKEESATAGRGTHVREVRMYGRMGVDGCGWGVGMPVQSPCA